MRIKLASVMVDDHSEPSLRSWLWLGTGVSALFWGLAAYGVLAAMDRKSGVNA